MKDKPSFTSHGHKLEVRYDAVCVVGFPAGGRPGVGKYKAKGKGAAAHTAQLCDSAFLAERGCFGRAIAPGHPVPHH
jgi:hypothetical protein